MIEYDGKEYRFLSALAAEHSLHPTTVRYRLDHEIPLTEPLIKDGKPYKGNAALDYKGRSIVNPLRKWQPSYLSQGVSVDQGIALINVILERAHGQ